MTKLWHVFGYTINHQWNTKTFVNKIVAAENETDAISFVMLSCDSNSFQSISVNSFNLENGMIFDPNT